MLFISFSSGTIKSGQFRFDPRRPMNHLTEFTMVTRSANSTALTPFQMLASVEKETVPVRRKMQPCNVGLAEDCGAEHDSKRSPARAGIPGHKTMLARSGANCVARKRQRTPSRQGFTRQGDCKRTGNGSEVGRSVNAEEIMEIFSTRSPHKIHVGAVKNNTIQLIKNKIKDKKPTASQEIFRARPLCEDKALA